MKNTVDLSPVLSFLKQLAKNNDRAWFEAHGADYESALGRFEDFVAALIVEISAFHDLEETTPRDCIFRIYRDVRYSKDKSPYKTNMAASITWRPAITPCAPEGVTKRQPNRSPCGGRPWTRTPRP